MDDYVYRHLRGLICSLRYAICLFQRSIDFKTLRLTDLSCHRSYYMFILVEGVGGIHHRAASSTTDACAACSKNDLLSTLSLRSPVEREYQTSVVSTNKALTFCYKNLGSKGSLSSANTCNCSQSLFSKQQTQAQWPPSKVESVSALATECNPRRCSQPIHPRLHPECRHKHRHGPRWR